MRPRSQEGTPSTGEEPEKGNRFLKSKAKKKWGQKNREVVRSRREGKIKPGTRAISCSAEEKGKLSRITKKKPVVCPGEETKRADMNKRYKCPWKKGGGGGRPGGLLDERKEEIFRTRACRLSLSITTGGENVAMKEEITGKKAARREKRRERRGYKEGKTKKKPSRSSIQKKT